MECFYPRTIKLPDGFPQVVRCEKCLACLEHRQAGWITRLSQEFKDSPDGVYFLTLTYDDEHLPTMVIDGRRCACISTEDIKKFHADLRKRFQQGFYNDHTLEKAGWSPGPTRISLPPSVHFKYYVTSEYGPETKRPHYHGFYSHLPEDEDLVFDLFNQIWGKGFITMEKGKSEACASYVSKYLVNDSLVPVDRRLPKPRAWMSKGLGSSYLDSDNILEWHRSSPSEHLFVMNNGRKGVLPRYLRDKILDDSMKQEVLEGCLVREEKHKVAFSMLSPYEQLRQGLENKHRHEEAVRQAEWHFRRKGKLK